MNLEHFNVHKGEKNANYTHTTNDKETNTIQTINSFYGKEAQERQTIGRDVGTNKSIE